jgi:hypothetical protein
LYKPDLVVLPITIQRDETSQKTIKLFSAEDLREEGYLHAARWFQNVENVWQIHRTTLNNKFNSSQYLNFQNKITSQNMNASYFVLYNSLGKDANALVVNRTDYDLPFIVDYKSYVYFTYSKTEAYYLSAVLNSSIPNELIKDFQARGLFGARGVEKKILDVYFPKFNEKNKLHLQLAQLSEQAHAKARVYLTSNPPKQELTSIFLGRLRVEIKKHLKEEMQVIDETVKEVSG